LLLFYPELRSIKRINDSIYKYFGASRDEDRWPEIQAIVLAEENRQAVIDVINRAKELYQEVVGKGKHEVVQNDEPWNVPEIINLQFDFRQKRLQAVNYSAVLRQDKRFRQSFII